MRRDRLHGTEGQGATIRRTRSASNGLYSPAWPEPVANRLQRSFGNFFAYYPKEERDEFDGEVSELIGTRRWYDGNARRS